MKDFVIPFDDATRDLGTPAVRSDITDPEHATNVVPPAKVLEDARTLA